MQKRSVHLQVTLPKNRNFTGRMVILIDNQPTGDSFPVKGRGSRGAGNTMFLENGNTPDGQYRGEIVSTKGWAEGSYGPNGAIRLHPLSGNAYTAWKTYKRKGLLIHGGSPPTEKSKNLEVNSGGLRPTFGCLRLSNENVKRLMNVLEDAKWVLPPEVNTSYTEMMSPKPILELASGNLSQYLYGRLFTPITLGFLQEPPPTEFAPMSTQQSLVTSAHIEVELDIRVTVTETP